jgi:hypothetical protein
MRFRSAAPFVLLAALCSPACGKKGAILPPLILRPQPVETLSAVQRGGRIILEWADPTASVDGTELAGVSEAEVWLEIRPDPPPAAGLPGRFIDRAKRVGTLTPPPAPARETFEHAFDPKGWKGRAFVFAVRTRESSKKRLSDFSNEAVVRPRTVPNPPSGLRARVFQDRIELAWSAPPANFDGSAPAAVRGYTVYRSEKDGAWTKATAQPLREPAFADREFEFGRTYRYLIRSVTDPGPGFTESEDGPVFEVKPADTFPPAAPAGISIAAGPDFLTLAWDAGPEKDLAGYLVWRWTGDAANYIRLTSAPIIEMVYTDRSVEKGVRYTYFVTAVDTAGNESARSAAVSEIIKDPRP